MSKRGRREGAVDMCNGVKLMTVGMHYSVCEIQYHLKRPLSINIIEIYFNDDLLMLPSWLEIILAYLISQIFFTLIHFCLKFSKVKFRTDNKPTTRYNTFTVYNLNSIKFLVWGGIN